MKNQSSIPQGFTLIELMVSIALIAVLMMVAAPSLTTFQRNAELTSISNSLLASINAARGEAMKRGQYAMVVPAVGNDWGSGWVVFVDIDRSSDFDAADDVSILSREALPSYLEIPTPTGTANESPPYLMFDASGYSKNKAGGFGAVTFEIRRNDVSGAEQLRQTRRVKIASTGRVRVCTPASSTDTLCSATSLF